VSPLIGIRAFRVSVKREVPRAPQHHWYVTEGAGEAYIVMTNSENGGFGVLYEAPIPFSDWHAFGGDTQGRSTPSAPVDLRAVLDRMQNEGE
jgi:hypothetical protein